MKAKLNSSQGATMRAVADRAGVSLMTVSLALRGDDGSARLAPETRERVRLVASELGYVQNARARALRLGRTNVIGLYAGHGYVNVRLPFFTEVVSGLQEGCEQIRRDLLLHGVFHSTSEGEIVRELADGRIDGLIVSVPFSSSLLQSLLDSGFPVVSLADHHPGVPSVAVDDAGGAAQIASYLHELGHRKVVYVTSPDPSIPSAERRMASFVSTARSLGQDTEVVRPVDESAAGGVVRTAVKQGATALVCWNDVSAYDILAQCALAGISVPADLSVVGFDGVPLPYGLPSALTTVVAPWAEAARLAVLMLNARLSGEDVEPLTILPVHLSPGTTTRSIS